MALSSAIWGIGKSRASSLRGAVCTIAIDFFGNIFNSLLSVGTDDASITHIYFFILVCVIKIQT
jgi:hypothetical protein